MDYCIQCPGLMISNSAKQSDLENACLMKENLLRMYPMQTLFINSIANYELLSWLAYWPVSMQITSKCEKDVAEPYGHCQLLY